MYIENKNDFEKYYTKHLGKNPMDLHNYGITNQTPAIIETSSLNGTVISVFDRLMKDRIIFVNGAVDDYMCNIINAQLMYLDTCEDENGNSDIKFYINSPGGSVYAGLSTIDAMNCANADVYTTCNGMAASFGAVFLGAGKKGFRTITRFGRVMLHQSSGGVGGNIQDAEIAMVEWKDLNETLLKLLSGYCDKDVETVREASSRDLWLPSKKSLEFGIVDIIQFDNETEYTIDDLSKIPD